MLNRLLTFLTFLTFSIGINAQPNIKINYHCDSAILWVNSPASPFVYYWQGTTCGTNMTMSDTTYKALASTAYFIRAYNSSASTWASTCGTASVILAQNPDEPQYVPYSNKTFTLLTPPANVIYYAQGTACGQSTAHPGPTYPITASGTYYFNALDTMYKCWSLVCKDTTIELVSAIYDNYAAKSISILPNPAVNEVTVTFPSELDNVNLAIYDFSGKVVLHKSDIKTNSSVDISRLKPGTYIARFSNSDMNQSIKLVKTR